MLRSTYQNSWHLYSSALHEVCSTILQLNHDFLASKHDMPQLRSVIFSVLLCTFLVLQWSSSSPERCTGHPVGGQPIRQAFTPLSNHQTLYNAHQASSLEIGNQALCSCCCNHRPTSNGTASIQNTSLPTSSASTASPRCFVFRPPSCHPGKGPSSLAGQSQGSCVRCLT